MSNTRQPVPFQMTRVISALMVREMTTRYGRSAGGYFWAVAEPVGMIAVLSIAFSAFLRSPPLGSSFVLFYATGYMTFTFYSNLNGQISNAVKQNRALMKLPMVSPLDTILARGLLQVLTLIVVSVVIFGALSFFLDEPIRLDWGEFMLACFGASILGFGGGTLNTVLYAFFPVYKNIWAIISRPMFIVSGILYTVESMPSDIQAILLLNPLVHCTSMAHRAFYPIYDADFVMMGYPILLGTAMFLLGAALLARHRSFIIENS